MHDAYTGCTLAVRAFGRPTVIGEDEALVGNVVGERYQVGDVLGQGTTGTVFDVTHVSFARAAAMKVLRPRYASGDLVSRVFHGEARAAWSVSHPGLCEVFDIGSLPDGTPFFVMERLEGETLATRISRERLSLASAVDVMMQMLSAIAAIHARDLLLRDLRPQNVFLAHRRGCRPLLKILDFGLARLAPLDRVQSEWDEMRKVHGAKDGVGSTTIPYYLSPERTRGELGIEPASDLFVAAAILYEALAGQRPFEAPTFAAVVSQVCQGNPVPLHERRSDVTPELSAFIARALSPHPRARPASARDMQDELRAIFEGRRRHRASDHATEATAHAHGEHPRDGGGTTTAVLTAPTAVDSTPPMNLDEAPTGGESTFATMAPLPGSSSLTARTAAQPEDDYAEQTETQREALLDSSPPIQAARGPIAIGPIAIPLPLEGEDELSTAAGRSHALTAVPDEASADNVADRTVPPPPLSSTSAGEIEVEVSFDDHADKTMEKRAEMQRRAKQELRGGARKHEEEEETETMQLTPELRARVEQMMANAKSPTLPEPIPPPRRRAKRER